MHRLAGAIEAAFSEQAPWRATVSFTSVVKLG